MKFNQYLKDKVISIIIEIVTLLFVIFVLATFKINHSLIAFIVIVLLIAFFFSLIIEYARKNSFYKTVTKSIKEIDKKNLVFELIDEPGFCEGQVLYETLAEASKSMNDQIAMYKNTSLEYREYIETWVHEIKTPIAAIKLITQNNKNSVTKSIEEEIFKTESFIEQALFYSKSNTLEKDYIIREVSLDECVKSLIKKYSKSLIGNRFSIEMKDLNMNVFTDSKWIDFILGQIVTNSIKYKSENPKISFYTLSMSNSIVLIIEDNGVGIEEKDIKRVFDKGFTGQNGRVYAKSTGIGLYLCKKLCNKMGLSISLSSKKDEGTKVSIVFPKSKRELIENKA